MSVNGIKAIAFWALSTIGCASTGTQQVPTKSNTQVAALNTKAAQEESAMQVCTGGVARRFRDAIMANPEIGEGDRIILNNALVGATQQCVGKAEDTFDRGILVLGPNSQKKAADAAKSVQQKIAMAICSDGITGRAAELLGDARVSESAFSTLKDALLDVAGQCVRNVQAKFENGILHVSSDGWKKHLVTLQREVR